MKAAYVTMSTVLFVAGALPAQVIYNSSPNWISTDTPYSTGGALVDLDKDGWLDFVVANGNDIRREQLAVYYNNGDGTLPGAPDWLSADFEYNGHLSVADVNGDGWLDVAVGLTLDGDGTATARLYFNNAGTLSTLPDWESHDALAAFHVAFGDVNGDGRPDLAVGTSFPYSTPSHPWHNYVYMNTGDALETTPSWISDDTWDLGDIFFSDVNRDGWLDLVGAGENTYTWVYLNDAGSLAATATWHTTDNPGQFTVMGTYADVDADGWFELFTTDNTQLFTGSGYFRRYNGLVGGLFTQTPTWSYFDGYGSAIALADVDADGDLDLATGGWWDYTRYFLNDGGLFPTTPTWSSGGTSVVEAIVFGDVNKDGLRSPVESFDASATPGRHLFQLSRQPIDRIEYVEVDGVPLAPDEFTFDLVHGWVSVGPEPTASVTVRYVYSVRLDMAITNWDDTRGNYLYYNQNEASWFGDFEGDGDVDADDFAAFEGCYTGPGGGPLDLDCLPGDFDLDDDIDCLDWNNFVLAWTEPEDPPTFSECHVAPPLDAPYPHNRAKNRYISFDPNKTENDGLDLGFKVTLMSIALGSCSGNGAPCGTNDDCRQCSVTGTPCMSAAVDCEPDPPGQTCLLTGETCVNDGAGSTGSVWWVGPASPLGNDVHLLVTEPFRKVSAAWPAVVHVGDCEIVPRAAYGVQAVETNGGAESARLEVFTIVRPDVNYWADGVGPLGDYCTGTWAECPNGDPDCPPGESCFEQWPPPEGITNFNDITAAVFAFQQAPGLTLPDVTWVDMHGDGGGSAADDPPNFILNFADIANIVAAFQGRPYPFSDPAQCPNASVWP